MNDQGRNIDLRNILAEVLVPGGHAGQTSRGGSNRSDIPAGLNRLLADPLSEILVGVVEVFEEIGEERVTVSAHLFLDSFENASINSFSIISSLQEVGRNASHDDSFAYVLRTIFADIARDFATAHGEANQNKI